MNPFSNVGVSKFSHKSALRSIERNNTCLSPQKFEKISQLISNLISYWPGKVNKKFSFSIFWYSKSVLNSNLETPVLKPHKKQNVFSYLTCFSAIVDFILFFCTSLSSETWSFELIIQLLLFYSHQQKMVFQPSF